MTWYIVRAIAYILICISIWFGGQYFITQELQASLQKISPYAIYVDQNAHSTTSHTGSLTYPFLTITEALAAAEIYNIPTVIVNPGTYRENFTIPDNTLLFGYATVTIAQDPSSLQNTIQTGHNSTLLNLVVSGGLNAIMIPHNTAASLINVTASDAGDYGILMGKSQRPPIPDDPNAVIPYEYLYLTGDTIEKLPHVYFHNVTITRNSNQGMYLRDGRVTIADSHIFENGEEGIDLHPHMIALISNTESSHNGESGLETEIYDNIVTITNSVFDNNVKNGVGFITSYGTGEMLIKNSIITNNLSYGIRCARHKNSPDEPRPFFRSVITTKDSEIKNNAGGDVSDPCFLF